MRFTSLVKLLVAIFAGAAFAVIASRYLFVGSWLSLILWAIAGLTIGAWCQRRSQAMLNGAVFGFAVSFVFMWSGYTGSASLISRLPFFAILGMVGAVCGFVLGFVGYMIRGLVQRGRNHPSKRNIKRPDTPVQSRITLPIVHFYRGLIRSLYF